MSLQKHHHTHTVTTADGAVVSYEIRGLQESEVPQWAEFCASIFAYKASPPPASYFERHFFNDPNRDASMIRVAFFGTEMVASCRVFLRTISLGRNGSTCNAGGIGEVCTSADHRRRGLSKVLLQSAISIMNEHQLPLSLLHAAPAFFPVYEASGYSCTQTRWSVLKISKNKLTEYNKSKEDGCIIVRPASFPKDSSQLQALHKHYTEDRIAGTIIRSRKYWDEYLSVELKDSLWVAAAKQEEDDETSNLLLGWMSIRPRNGRFQLREFGVNAEPSTARKVFPVLLAKCLESETIIDDSSDVISLAIPSFVMEDLQKDQKDLPFIEWAAVESDDDQGWMYKTLEAGSVDMPNIIQEGTNHLVWPSDSF